VLFFTRSNFTRAKKYYDPEEGVGNKMHGILYFIILDEGVFLVDSLNHLSYTLYCWSLI
jgi:hypothetical protein